MADVSLLGLRPGAHHAVNASLHALNAALVFLLLSRATRRAALAAIAAALFAAHPLQVESVAWIAQRKTVLSMALLLLSFLAYEAWTRRGGAARYLVSLAAFAAAVSAKPTAVVGPALLLAMDAWPLGRLDARSLGRRLLEKVPFVAFAAAASVLTVLAQSEAAALGTLASHPWPARLAHVAAAYAWYPAKLVWPSGLSLFYPTELASGGVLKLSASVAFLLAALGGTLLAARRRPYIAAGAAWYAIALLPVSGLVAFGTQLVADRYFYLPSVGVLAVVVWTVGDIAERRSVALRRAAALVGALAVLALALATHRQLAFWSGSATILSRGVETAPSNIHALLNYGLWLAEDDRVPEALPYLERAVAIAPGFRTGQVNLGWALAKAGRLDEARAYYDEALRLFPEDAPLQSEFGRVLARLGRVDEAEARLRDAVRLDPRFAPARLLLGTLLYDRGRFPEAETHLESAVALAPGLPMAKTALGANLAALGRKGEAIEALRAGAVPGPAGDRARLELEKLGYAAGGRPEGSRVVE